MTALPTADAVHAWHAGLPVTLTDADDLNDLAEFDLPFTIEPGGLVRMARDEHAPEAYVTLDADGQEVDGAEAAWMVDLESQGWRAITGFSGQQGYIGPHMHPSEYLGGGMADHVLATPGTYVVIAVNGLRDLPEDEYDDGMRDADYGYAWSLLRRIA